MPSPPVLVDNEEEYVSQILDSRVPWEGRQYLVDWEGRGPEGCSWGPADNVYGPDVVQQLHTNYPDKPGPPSGGTVSWALQWLSQLLSPRQPLLGLQAPQKLNPAPQKSMGQQSWSAAKSKQQMQPSGHI